MFSDSDPNFQERGGANGNGRLTFAFKLWEVANDGQLIKWNSAGDGVVVKQREYEEVVQDLYPRFAQNSSFLNLKRLFRDYGFQPHVLRRKKPHGLIAEFSHPMFRRDDYENIINVTAKERGYKYKVRSSAGYYVYRARRKYTRRFPNPSSVLSSSSLKLNVAPSRLTFYNDDIPCPPRKRGRPRTRLQTQTSSSSANSSFSEVAELVSSSTDQNQNDKLSNADMFRVFQIFAKNELSEEVYVETVLKRFGDKFQHLMDGPFEDIVHAFDGAMDPGLSPFCFSESVYEYSLDEL